MEVNGNPHRFKARHIPGTAVLTPQNAIDIRQLYAKGELSATGGSLFRTY